MFDPMTMINMMIKSNPQMSQYWNMAQQMTQGKSAQEIETIAKNIAQQKGIDMNQVNQMFQQFMQGNMKF